jgi:hypothetical protein
VVAERQKKAQSAVRLKWEAKKANCEAYLSSEGKNETARTSHAELNSLTEQTEAEQARVEAKAAEFLLEFSLSHSDMAAKVR